MNDKQISHVYSKGQRDLSSNFSMTFPELQRRTHTRIRKTKYAGVKLMIKLSR